MQKQIVVGFTTEKKEKSEIHGRDWGSCSVYGIGYGRYIVGERFPYSATEYWENSAGSLSVDRARINEMFERMEKAFPNEQIQLHVV